MDEDFMREALVRGLRERGIDVLTAHEAGMIERTDADHLAFAASAGRILRTFDVGDFWQLHSEYLANGRTHAGIILVRQQHYSVGELLRRLLRIATTLSTENMIDRAEFLSAWEPSA